MSAQTETEAGNLAKGLDKYIKKKGGRYLREEDGGLNVVLNNHRIAINFDRDNTQLAALMIAACKTDTISQTAQKAIQRLRVVAAQQAGRMKYRRFSAVSADGNRIYIPLADGKTLRVCTDSMEPLENGADGLWVEHPSGEPFRFELGDPRDGLETFERLVVDTQACAHPEMRWLVAMQLALFPFIRDLFPARFLTQFRGPSQEGGKTSGAQRFTQLHGLGDVRGDCSVAMLQNEGEIGLLALDNKEQANFKQPLIDFFLFLATGAQHGRSNVDGTIRVNRGRPVTVFTTIEGVPKQEVQNRTVTVEYRISGERLSRASLERDIVAKRHKVLSAFMPVLQHYLGNRDSIVAPDPMPAFRENFQADADLLRSFSSVSGKSEGWADEIIAVWADEIGGRELEENELEHPICRIFEERLLVASVTALEWNGRKGSLHVVTAGALLTALQRLGLRDRSFPTSPGGLGHRLNSCQFSAFKVLTEKTAPQVAVLKRKSDARVLGLFFPDEHASSMTE